MTRQLLSEEKGMTYFLGKNNTCRKANMMKKKSQKEKTDIHGPLSPFKA